MDHNGLNLSSDSRNDGESEKLRESVLSLGRFIESNLEAAMNGLENGDLDLAKVAFSNTEGVAELYSEVERNGIELLESIALAPGSNQKIISLTIATLKTSQNMESISGLTTAISRRLIRVLKSEHGASLGRIILPFWKECLSLYRANLSCYAENRHFLDSSQEVRDRLEASARVVSQSIKAQMTLNFAQISTLLELSFIVGHLERIYDRSLDMFLDLKSIYT